MIVWLAVGCFTYGQLGWSWRWDTLDGLVSLNCALKLLPLVWRDLRGMHHNLFVRPRALREAAERVPLPRRRFR
jgi:hypothetical protein